MKIANYKDLIKEDLNDWYFVSDVEEFDTQYIFYIQSYMSSTYEFMYSLDRSKLGGFYQLTILEEFAATPKLTQRKQLGYLLLNRANISNKHMIIRNMLSLAQSVPAIPNTKKQRQ